MLHRAGNFPVNPAPAATPAPFTLRAAACIAARLCCRVAVKLHQNVPSQSTIPDRASLESRITGAGDVVPPRRRKPRKVWPAPSIPHTDTSFSGRCRFRKGEKDRYRGGHDAPENFLLTQAACTAYSLKLPTPQNLPPRREGIVLAQPHSIRRSQIVLFNSGKGELWAN